MGGSRQFKGENPPWPFNTRNEELYSSRRSYESKEKVQPIEEKQEIYAAGLPIRCNILDPNDIATRIDYQGQENRILPTSCMLEATIICGTTLQDPLSQESREWARLNHLNDSQVLIYNNNAQFENNLGFDMLINPKEPFLYEAVLEMRYFPRQVSSDSYLCELHLMISQN